jgi:hypothetical protein
MLEIINLFLRKKKFSKEGKCIQVEKPKSPNRDEYISQNVGKNNSFFFKWKYKSFSECWKIINLFQRKK